MRGEKIMINPEPFAVNIIKTLEKAGFEAYIVGGAVRDMLLGMSPTDYDITTNALPEDIIAHFSKVLKTGIKHGTVTVISDGNQVEVTTFRTETGYSDNRHPDKVSFATSLEDDLSRRDFTVNAIACDSIGNVIDLFSGIHDLENRTLRTVGNPTERFKEDALRILRLFRFSAKLGFSIEPETYNAAIELSSELANLSKERIFSEIKSLLTTENPEAVFPLISCGGLKFIGLNKPNTKKAEEKLCAVSKSLPQRFTALLWLCNTDSSTLQKLKSDNKLRELCELRLKSLEYNLPTDIPAAKRFLNVFSEESVADILELHEILLGNDTRSSAELLNEVIKSKEAYSIKMLNINGNDLKKLGITGIAVGETLNRLLNLVIEQPHLNEKQILLSLLKE